MDKKIGKQHKLDMEEKEKCEKICLRLLDEYADCFRETLGPDDVINQTDIKIYMDRSVNITPTNSKTPTEIPIHLRDAADRELKNAIEAGILEECSWPTQWCSRGFFVEKGGNAMKGKSHKGRKNRKGG